LEKGVAKDPTLEMGGELLAEGLVSAEILEEIFLQISKNGVN
jgi:hypothetical protein